VGIFFERAGAASALVPILEHAYAQPPPPDADATAAAVHQHLADFNPVVAAVRSAVVSEPPADPGAQAQQAAQAAANALLGGATLNTGRFLVAAAIFLALLGTAIGCDASGLTSSTTAIYSLVSSIFGVIVGVLGGENTS